MWGRGGRPATKMTVRQAINSSVSFVELIPLAPGQLFFGEAIWDAPPQVRAFWSACESIARIQVFLSKRIL